MSGHNRALDHEAGGSRQRGGFPRIQSPGETRESLANRLLEAPGRFVDGVSWFGKLRNRAAESATPEVIPANPVRHPLKDGRKAGDGLRSGRGEPIVEGLDDDRVLPVEQRDDERVLGLEVIVESFFGVLWIQNARSGSAHGSLVMTYPGNHLELPVEWRALLRCHRSGDGEKIVAASKPPNSLAVRQRRTKVNAPGFVFVVAFSQEQDQARRKCGCEIVLSEQRTAKT